MPPRSSVFQSRLLLVLAGICLGYAARLFLGPPVDEMPARDRLPPAGTVESVTLEAIPELPLQREANRRR